MTKQTARIASGSNDSYLELAPIEYLEIASEFRPASSNKMKRESMQPKPSLIEEQEFLKAIDRIITPHPTAQSKPARNRKPTRKARNLQKRLVLGLGAA